MINFFQSKITPEGNKSCSPPHGNTTALDHQSRQVELSQPQPVSKYTPGKSVKFLRGEYEMGTSPPPRPAAPPPPLHTVLANIQPASPVLIPPRTSLALGPERRMSFFRLEDFELVRPLGTGTFGRVYLARYRAVIKYFALKKLRKVDVYRLKQADHVQNERTLLSRLNHPFIIRLYAAMQDERHLYMLMEYAPGGELFQYLRQAGRLSLDSARFYTAEIVLALEYLHAFGVTYRDLKPENLLLDAEGHLKLADFGFAKVVPDLTYTLCGTPEYLAPEIILGHGYGRSVDWWALGILLFEMLTGNPPFNGDTPTAVYERTLKGRVTYPAGLSAITVDLLSGLLTLDVTKRLGCSERGAASVREHLFFRGVDWSLIANRAYKPPIIPNTGDPDMALNFPHDDSKSSMDIEIPNEELILRAHGVHFPGFSPA